jgi:hypothetical protein
MKLQLEVTKWYGMEQEIYRLHVTTSSLLYLDTEHLRKLLELHCPRLTLSRGQLDKPKNAYGA